jgi:predicted RNase H-like HicB family nuclease
MKRPFNASITKEGRWFVAQCLEVDVASQGRTEKDALTNLREALELHFAPPHATLLPTLKKVEAQVSAV